MVDREGGSGQGEHHDGEEASHERTGPGIRAGRTTEEAGDVTVQSLAGGVGAIAELEPRQRIEQVVQAEGDEETVDGAEYESRSWVGPVGHDETADLLIEQPVEGRVNDSHDDAGDDGSGGGDNWHEAAAAKEG